MTNQRHKSFHKTCDYCRADFLANRSHARFCCATCRAYAHQEEQPQRSMRQAATKATNDRLWRNRELLRQWHGNGAASLHELEAEGFSLRHLTHFEPSIVIGNKSQNILFCYDYGYFVTDAESQSIKIIRQ